MPSSSQVIFQTQRSSEVLPSPQLHWNDYSPISEITSDSQHNIMGFSLDWSVGFCTFNFQLTPPLTAMISPAPSLMRARRCFPYTPEIPVKACQFPCERGFLGFVDHCRWIFLILIVILTLIVLIICIARTRAILPLTCGITTGITTGYWSLVRGSGCNWYQSFLFVRWYSGSKMSI